MESRQSNHSAGEWEEECRGKRAARVSGAWRAAGAITAQVSGKRNAEVREPQEYPEYGELPEQL